jgi:hypothetical protein
MLELQQKHEIELIKVKHKNEMEKLRSECNHKYDDGTKANVFTGVQWNPSYKCGICGCAL